MRKIFAIVYSILTGTIIISIIPKVAEAGTNLK
jgi:hypothetical protein